MTNGTKYVVIFGDRPGGGYRESEHSAASDTIHPLTPTDDVAVAAGEIMYITTRIRDVVSDHVELASIDPNLESRLTSICKNAHEILNRFGRESEFEGGLRRK